MKTATIYLHSDKESNREIGEEIGLTGEALDRFCYSLYEVKVDLAVDDDGNSRIVAVDGRPLA